MHACLGVRADIKSSIEPARPILSNLSSSSGELALAIAFCGRESRKEYKHVQKVNDYDKSTEAQQYNNPNLYLGKGHPLSGQLG